MPPLHPPQRLCPDPLIPHHLCTAPAPPPHRPRTAPAPPLRRPCAAPAPPLRRRLCPRPILQLCHTQVLEKTFEQYIMANGLIYSSPTYALDLELLSIYYLHM